MMNSSEYSEAMSRQAEDLNGSFRWTETEVGDDGRYVMITDGPDGECYISEMPQKADLDDAIFAFCRTYDTGEATDNIQCRARLFVAGEEVESDTFQVEV